MSTSSSIINKIVLYSLQIERYCVSGLHSSKITALEWSLNGMKIFSGDINGLIVLTKLDFYMVNHDHAFGRNMELKFNSFHSI